MTLARIGAEDGQRVAVDAGELFAAKRTHQISVCIPARDEAATIGGVVKVAKSLVELELVDEVVVVDDGSQDSTPDAAAEAGARVISSTGGPGKGQALRSAIAATSGDILVFVDADVTNFTTRFISDLIRPLLFDPVVQLAKATYRRPLAGRADEGGRVTELLARPLLRRFFPDLAGTGQPLAGECAVRRATLDLVHLTDGYGIEIGLLIDVFRLYGRDAIVDVDLGERIHRHRALLDLQPHADQVLAAVLERVAGVGGASPPRTAANDFR